MALERHDSCDSILHEGYSLKRFFRDDEYPQIAYDDDTASASHCSDAAQPGASVDLERSNG